MTGSSKASTIQGFKLESFTVPVGTTVTWTNKDSAPHTVTAENSSFMSPTLNQGSTFTFTFTKAGTYGYFCALHAGMTGTVTVQ